MPKLTVSQEVAYQEMVESLPAFEVVRKRSEIVGMIHKHSYPAVFVATVVIDDKEHCMEFASKDDDKTLDYSEAFNDACLYASKKVATNGAWEWEDLPKSAA